MNFLRKYMFWLKNYCLSDTVSKRRIPEFWKHWQMQIILVGGIFWNTSITLRKRSNTKLEFTYRHRVGALNTLSSLMQGDNVYPAWILNNTIKWSLCGLWSERTSMGVWSSSKLRPWEILELQLSFPDTEMERVKHNLVKEIDYIKNLAQTRH